jgi:hypothetical protein
MDTEHRQKIMYGLGLLVLVMGSGILFYHTVERWSWVDAVYFVAVTTTTVGYGDITPSHPAGRLFTVVYVLLAVPLVLFILTMLAESYFEGHVSRMEKANFIASQRIESMKNLARSGASKRKQIVHKAKKIIRNYRADLTNSEGLGGKGRTAYEGGSGRDDRNARNRRDARPARLRSLGRKQWKEGLLLKD